MTLLLLWALGCGGPGQNEWVATLVGVPPFEVSAESPERMFEVTLVGTGADLDEVEIDPFGEVTATEAADTLVAFRFERLEGDDWIEAGAGQAYTLAEIGDSVEMWLGSTGPGEEREQSCASACTFTYRMTVSHWEGGAATVGVWVEAHGYGFDVSEDPELDVAVTMTEM